MVRKHGKQGEARPAAAFASKPGTAFHSKLVNHGILHRLLGFGNRFGDDEEPYSYKAAKRLKVDQSLAVQLTLLRGSSVEI